MGLIKNAINFGNGFNIGAVAPIDSRMRVEKVSDLTSVWTAEIPAYKGMIVSVMETSEVYVLKDAENYTSSDSWVKLGSADAATANTANALKEAKEYTDALANGAVKTNTNAIATLNGDAQTAGSVAKAVADEKGLREAADKAITDIIGTVDDGKTVMGTIAEEVVNRQTAISDLKGALGEGDATTLKAINDELDTIDKKIGVVPSSKTVVGMIADAESAAKAAATKLNEKTSGHVTVSGVQDQTTKAWTYTISENDIASAKGLQDEIDRAVGAEASLQAQIGTRFTSRNTVADAIDDVKDTINALNADVTSAEGTKVRVQVVETAGKITAVNITDVDIASATGLTAEINARTTADTNLQSQIGKAATEEGGPTGLHKEIADAKTDLIGSATTEYNTLGKLEGKIKDAVAAAKTYSIAKATESEVGTLGANVKEAYKLVDEHNVKVGEFIPVYKDSSLKSAELINQELVFTYTLADNTEQIVRIDVSTFLAESEFKNGLEVNSSGEVSVKVDTASEAFLTVGEGGVKLSGVQSAIDTAKNAVTARLDIIEGGEGVTGSIKKALKDAKDYTDDEINKLDAEVTSTDGSHVTVKVTEVDGVITAVNVTESDIASATGLTAINNKIGSVTEGKTVVEMIVAAQTAAEGHADSVKSELLGDAAEGYNTLGKLEDKIIAAEAAAKAAATKLDKESSASHLTLTSVTGTSGEITYTIGEDNIASASDLTAEVTRAKAAEEANAANIAAEASRADAAEKANAANIAAEKTRAEGIESGLNTRLAAVEADYVKSVEAVEGSMITVSETKQKVTLSLQWGTF